MPVGPSPIPQIEFKILETELKTYVIFSIDIPVADKSKLSNIVIQAKDEWGNPVKLGRLENRYALKRPKSGSIKVTALAIYPTYDSPMTGELVVTSN